MICMYADSHLCTFTFILCTCIWIPLHRTTQLLAKILAFLVNPHHQLPDETPSCNLDLPVSHFRDVDNEEEVEEEEMCSICLVEFEKKDLVNKLVRCGHTFHVECMEKWLETCQFTCPLCRSRLLRHPSSTLPHCHS